MPSVTPVDTVTSVPTRTPVGKMTTVDTVAAVVTQINIIYLVAILHILSILRIARTAHVWVLPYHDMLIQRGWIASGLEEEAQILHLCRKQSRSLLHFRVPHDWNVVVEHQVPSCGSSGLWILIWTTLYP
jgi:hypothetical protein